MLFAVALAALFGAPLVAQTVPSPSPAPVPSASASPAPPTGSVTFAGEAHVTFVSQNTNGFGQLGLPEAPGFISGTSPDAPLTPYDTFSSAPMTPGDAEESALYLTPTYHGSAFDVAATFGLGNVLGSTTNAAYWGESLIEPLNPHLGSQTIGYGIALPTSPGQDDGSGFVASVLSGSIATKDGNAQLRGGWFDLTQSDGFVFTQPAYQSAIPALAVLPAESLGDGPPTADWWTLADGVYPLHGLDFIGKSGDDTLELTDATLPSLPGSSARATVASFVDDHGAGTRYSVDVAHVTTGGAPVPTTILFAQGTPVVTSQGYLPFGTVGGQRETIYGLRGAFHVFGLADGVVEYGPATTTMPGSPRPCAARAWPSMRTVTSRITRPRSSRTARRRTSGRSRGRGRASGSSRTIS
jgi:hypothetical protein